jgi:hypothetical protein
MLREALNLLALLVLYLYKSTNTDAILREGVIQSEAAQNLVDKAANLTNVGVGGVTQVKQVLLY